MNELIKVTTNEEGQQLVSARDLHEVLIVEEGKKERFSQWFNRHLQYGFEENVDYVGCKKIYAANQHGAIGELDDYAMTIEMAKELSMLQKSDKGREVRKYFIECEKKLKELSERDNAILLVMNSTNDIERVSALKYFEDVVKKPLIETINKQNNTIEEQTIEIEHKEDVIITLTKDVTIAEKRQRINDIVRYGAKGRFGERWGLLYKEFDSKFHINTKRRLENAKERGEVKQSMTRMDYICDVLELTSELFDLATVVFEADYIEMLQDYIEVAKRK